jgi:large subunit ribosomal protein L30
MLKIRLRKSLIGEKPATRRTAQALGFNKRGSEVTVEDTPSVRGMIHKLRHLIDFVEDEDQTLKKRSKKPRTVAEIQEKEVAVEMAGDEVPPEER